MTKKDLEHYVRDKRTLARRQDELLAGDMSVVDTVKGSLIDSPYTEHSIVIEGQDVQRMVQLGRRIEQLKAKCQRVEAFVAGVEDEELRDILRFRFLQGCSWPRVMRKMNCRVSPDAARMRVDRFFKKSS